MIAADLVALLEPHERFARVSARRGGSARG